MSQEPITIDFETRSEADLRAVGAWNYAKHPTTLVLCLAFALTANDVPRLWVPGDGPATVREVRLKADDPNSPMTTIQTGGTPDELFAAIKAGRLVEAHNAFFERTIWKFVCVDRMGWPPVEPKQWRCSMAKAQAVGLPASLGMLAKALGLDEQKDDRGRRVMLKLAKPRKPSKNNPSKWFNDPADFETLYRYCLKDVSVERAVSQALPEMSPRELSIWQLDQVINVRGVPIDRRAVAAGMAIANELEAERDKRIEEITDGAVTATGQRDKILTWIETQWAGGLDNLRAGTVADTLARGGAPANVEEVLRLRQQGSLTSTKKLFAMFDRSDAADCRARNLLRYHGAHTGRWAGAGVQPQNFPSDQFSRKADPWNLTEADVDNRVSREIETLIRAIALRSQKVLRWAYGDPITAIKWALRSMISAAPGKRFLCCDFSQIEVRVLAWLSGQESMLEIFHGDGKIYEDMAAAIYNVAIDDVTKAQRAVGKVAILGLGYGMGGANFYNQLDARGIEATTAFASEVVEVYRTKYSKVHNYWKATERAAKNAVNNPGEKFIVGKDNTRICYEVRGKFLTCTLPSGRVLHYYKPRILNVKTDFGIRPALTYAGVDSFTKQWTRIKTYGAKLVENNTQATARDFMVEGMFNCERSGYPILLTVHDEIFSEVDEGFGSVSEMVSLMSAVPDWGNGCPIAAEGFEAKRYRK